MTALLATSTGGHVAWIVFWAVVLIGTLLAVGRWLTGVDAPARARSDRDAPQPDETRPRPGT